MTKSFFFLIPLLALFIGSAFIAQADNHLVIGSNCYPLAEIDSVTFSADQNGAYQTIWRANNPVSQPLVSGQKSVILPTNIQDSIYRLGANDEWSQVFMTPIGFFYYSPNCRIIPELYSYESNRASLDLWCYESYDGLSSAQMLFDPTKSITPIFEHDNGFVLIYDDCNPDSCLSLSHNVGEDENYIDDFINPQTLPHVNERANLVDVLTLITGNYNNYRPVEFDSVFVELVEKFRSILSKPLSDSFICSGNNIPTVEENKTKTAEKMKKKKFHSAIFTIRLFTTPYVVPISSSEALLYLFKDKDIKCASSNAVKHLEFGYIAGETGDNITVESARWIWRCSDYDVDWDNTEYHRLYFPNLKQDKDYYYRLYCKIPKEYQGAYVFRFGNRKATIGYGNTKSFKTLARYRLTPQINGMDTHGFHVDFEGLVENGVWTALRFRNELLYSKANEALRRTSAPILNYIREQEYYFERDCIYQCDVCGESLQEYKFVSDNDFKIRALGECPTISMDFNGEHLMSDWGDVESHLGSNPSVCYRLPCVYSNSRYSFYWQFNSPNNITFTGGSSLNGCIRHIPLSKRPPNSTPDDNKTTWCTELGQSFQYNPNEVLENFSARDGYWDSSYLASFYRQSGVSPDDYVPRFKPQDFLFVIERIYEEYEAPTHNNAHQIQTGETRPESMSTDNVIKPSQVEHP